MSLYVIGVGGTGAKCIEAIVQLASVGLIPSKQLKVLFVDADETNGNLQRSNTTLSVYQKCHELMKGNPEESPWMSTDIESYGVWSPFTNNNADRKLGSFFSYNLLKQSSPALANLFDVLYTEDERQVSLEVGFRGRPAIGSSIMTQINLDRLEEQPWQKFIFEVKSNSGGGTDTKILLCGSIFGGTGASGLPTIGRLISNKLEKEGVRDKVKIGCIFGLPYFNFPAGNADEQVYASSELFLLNTEAALRYYKEQAQQFDTKYLIGNQTMEKLGEFSVGKDTQVNRSHFVEFYAGLAARHFFCENLDRDVHVITRNQAGILQWNDIPESEEVKTKLVNATRFAYIWLAEFKPQLELGQNKGIKELNGFAWFDKFFQGRGFMGMVTRKELPDLGDSQQQEAIKTITAWCEDFLRWVRDIHYCDNETIKLFKAREYFSNPRSVKGEKLSDLVHDDNRTKDVLTLDNTVTLKNSIGELNPADFGAPNQGVGGLAKAIYLTCKV
ncbi:hypothetical protein ACN4EE_17365 [Geminocystis sp. CENA526]|uniref:tubulin-like doman-containing protein n=1 Tax=Geminocystis sp. CENA526 TaxID=1355871 RepID=UPI003D6F0650